MSEQFAVVIGGMNIDIHGTSTSAITLHDSNPGTIQTCAGGVARNIAENLAQFDVDTRLLAPIGQDVYGQALKHSGEAAGIDMQYILHNPSLPTSSYLSVVDEHGEMLVGIADMSIMETLNADWLRQHEDMLQCASVIVVDANLSKDALNYIFNTFSQQPIFVDTVSTTKALRLKPFLKSIHTLKPSLLEAETMANCTASTDEELRELAEWFHQQGVRRLFITLGEKGVFYSTPEHQAKQILTISSIPAQNSGGGGDTFMAALTYAWLQQWTITQTVGFALSAASLTIANKDTNNPAISVAAVNRIYTEHYVPDSA